MTKLKYLHQGCLIFGFTFLGELLHFLIPLPIPASIYGMVLLFAALQFKFISVSAVKEMGGFLTSVIAVLFVPPIVALMDYWDLLRENILPIVIVLFSSSLLTFVISGRLTQYIIGKKEGKDHA